MKSQFDILRASRKNIVKLLESCTAEELVKVSPNYNNNLIWNAAHALVTTQLLCYKLSGNAMTLDEAIIDKYKKGSKVIEGESIDLAELISLLNTSADQLEADYNKGLFKSFNLYPTSFGFELGSIEDAIAFNNVHDGMHFGYMLAQKRGL